MQRLPFPSWLITEGPLQASESEREAEALNNKSWASTRKSWQICSGIEQAEGQLFA